jgi:hypothetical protein
MAPEMLQAIAPYRIAEMRDFSGNFGAFRLRN